MGDGQSGQDDGEQRTDGDGGAWLLGCLWVCLVVLGWGLVGAAAGQETEAAKVTGLRAASRAEYGEELQRLGELVEACRGRVTACDGRAVPGDETVDGAFQVHWGWLRDALKKGADAKDKDRVAALDGAAARLRGDVEALRQQGELVDDAEARRKVDEVLGGREFAQVQETQWWQRLIEKVAGKVQDALSRVGDVFPWSPWMGVALEWGVLGAAAAALIVWAFRMSQLQRVGFAVEREPAGAWQAESDDWAARAKEEAARGEWREAVHCLYWSAIVMLEGQKLWRQNRARTPREYVGLLEPGSARRRVLGGLTGVFERIWYGIRPATSGDYEKAAALLDELRVG